MPSSKTLRAPGVIAVTRSGNAKTGEVAATYVSQQSCPKSCVFQGNGCYAETGYTGFTTSRVNDTGEGLNPVDLALNEWGLIEQLPGDRPLRVHVVGDATTPITSALVAWAMMEYTEQHGQWAWTYTHSWREVERKYWGTANVLASCETPEQVKEAWDRGYAAVLVVDEFPTKKRFMAGDIPVIPCPEMTSGVKCVDCRLCSREEVLRGKAVVGFAAHGVRASKVKAAIKQERGS